MQVVFSNKFTTLYSEFNKNIIADTNILANDILIAGDGLLRLTVSVNTDGVFSIIIKRNSQSIKLKYNAGGDILADCAYAFDIGIRGGDSINFQHSETAKLNLINVDFVAV